MAFNKNIAARLREALSGHPDVVEKKMFGGMAFMVGGHMSVGVIGDSLMVRVGPDLYDEAVSRPGAKPMDFTGKPMKGFVFVDASNLLDKTLTEWIDLSLIFVTTLPPKAAK